MKKNSKIIAAAPLTGKTYEANNNSRILDLEATDYRFIYNADGSRTENAEFPHNYVKAMQELSQTGEYDVIFVGTYKNVLDAMKEDKVNYSLVYPDISLKHEYIQRAEQRGNRQAFIDFLSDKWDTWFDETSNDTGSSEKIIMQQGEYMKDCLSKIKGLNIKEQAQQEIISIDTESIKIEELHKRLTYVQKSYSDSEDDKIRQKKMIEQIQKDIENRMEKIQQAKKLDKETLDTLSSRYDSLSEFVANIEQNTSEQEIEDCIVP